MVQIQRPPGAPQASRLRPQIAPLRCSVSQTQAGTRSSSASTRCSSASGGTETDCALITPCTARTSRTDSVSSCPLPAFGTCRSEFPVVPRRCASAQPEKQRAGRRWPSESVSLRGPKIERCSCCTKQEFWTWYDVFAAMDRRGVGAVQRTDFVWALSGLGASIDFQKTCRRAALPSYFHDTAKDLSMEEFMRHLLPSVTALDLEQMRRWADLRKALKRLTRPDLRKSLSCRVENGSAEALKRLQEKGAAEEMHDVFKLLCRPGSDQLPAGVLVQADILTLEELDHVLPRDLNGTDLSFEEFSIHIQPVLVEKYGSTGEDEFEHVWRVAAHSRFQGTRASMMRAWEDERTSDRFGRSAERRTQLLPRLPLQNLAVNGSLARRSLKRSARRRGAEQPVAEATSPVDSIPGQGKD
mmetsp:Transcript_32944/g.60556  ORF Transcript_32944/g.60556 Transcript_32944/m.60556 type:complete len:413 (+) Transcript_32944:139-1377(+)